MIDNAGNTLDTALNLIFLSDVPRILEDTIGGDDFADYYRFKLSENSRIDLRLSDLSQNANLYIVDSEGNRELARSINSGTIDEQITLNLKAGVYFFYISGSSNSPTTYSLLGRAGSLGSVTVDGTGEILEKAKDLSEPSSAGVIVNDFIGNFNGLSQDYYRFELKDLSMTSATDLLRQAISLSEDWLRDFAQDPNFLNVFKKSFGNQFNVKQVEEIRQTWMVGDFIHLPDIQIENGAILQGANGVYAASLDKILVSEDFLKRHQNDVAAVTGLLLEEIGHKLDQVLNGNVDSPGDEGAIFRSLVTGQGMSPEILAGLRMQDDQAVITLDGKSIEVEKQDFFGDAGVLLLMTQLLVQQAMTPSTQG